MTDQSREEKLIAALKMAAQRGITRSRICDYSGDIPAADVEIFLLQLRQRGLVDYRDTPSGGVRAFKRVWYAAEFAPPQG